MLQKLRLLEEEDPMLRIMWDEELGEIYAQLMGAVQIEILQSLIRERFHTEVSFDTGNIVYKETIRKTVEGVGHFEPLRHYAEVHLLMEPGEPGSGIMLDTDCSEDELDGNWPTGRGNLAQALVSENVMYFPPPILRPDTYD